MFYVFCFVSQYRLNQHSLDPTKQSSSNIFKRVIYYLLVLKTGFQLGILCSYKNGMTALEVATAFGNQLKLGSAAKNNGIACALLFEKHETVVSESPQLELQSAKGLKDF